MEKKNDICQSCAMTMGEKDHGTNADGSISPDYCKYCFADGSFRKNKTMEESIEDDIHFWIDDNCKTPDQARQKLREIFPTLKRWLEVQR